MPKQEYQIEYDNFIAGYKKGVTDAEDAGQLISRLAQYFSNTNTTLGEKWRKMVIKSAEIINQTDSNTGKPIAVNRAELLISATTEAMELNDSKVDISNIEQMINAIKSLQRGMTNDYHHMGNT